MTLDPQHVAEHNLMVANLHAQCARFGLTPTSGGPYTVGDPDHIGEHGRYLDDLLTIELTAGRTFTKPIPSKNPVHGQTGHITDHEDLNAWITEASTWDAWNDGTGGTVTTYTVGSDTFRQHTFTSSTTFTVNRGTQPWDITIVAGGGGGGDPLSGQPGWCGGGGGGITLRAVAGPTLSGAVSVTVGGGGVFPNKGGNSGVAGVGECGGGGAGYRGDGWANNAPGIPGTWGGNSSGGTATPNTNNFTPWPSQSIRPPDGSNPPVTNAGRGGAAGYEAGSARPGAGGYVCISYRIG